jgi:LAGLIDADG endonuclease
MFKLNPNYIVGLVDGEGNFTVYVKNSEVNRKIKRRVRVEPRFFLKINETDKKILYELKKYFQKDS